MKEIKKIITVFLLSILIISVSILSLSNDVNAASKKSKALAAYNKMLERSAMFWDGNSGNDIELAKCEFLLAYIDNDNVPELVLYKGDNHNTHADGYYLLYTYRNGKVKLVANLMDGFSYFEKTGIFCAFHTGTGGGEQYYYKLSNGNYKYVLYSQNEMGYDIDGDGRDGIDYFKATSDANSWDGASMELITEPEFNSLLKQYVGNKKGKPDSYKSYHKNTLKNRRKYLNVTNKKDKYDKHGRVISDYSGRVSTLIWKYNLYESDFELDQLYEYRFFDNGTFKRYDLGFDGKTSGTPYVGKYSINKKTNKLKVKVYGETRVYSYSAKNHCLQTKIYKVEVAPNTPIKYRYYLFPYNRVPKKSQFLLN